MRMFLVSGSAVFVVYALIQPAALIVPALWETAFASIHAYMIYKLMSGDHITLRPNDLKLYGMVFQKSNLEIEEFQHLLSIGKWLDIKDGGHLTEAGKVNEHVYIIAEGVVGVVDDDPNTEVKLHAGQFVGEVTLLNDYQTHGHRASTTAASATCIAHGDVKVFVWKKQALLEFLETDESAQKVVQSLLMNVVEKFQSNVEHQWDANLTQEPEKSEGGKALAENENNSSPMGALSK